jgi:hypothetical protein
MKKKLISLLNFKYIIIINMDLKRTISELYFKINNYEIDQSTLSYYINVITKKKFSDKDIARWLKDNIRKRKKKRVYVKKIKCDYQKVSKEFIKDNYIKIAQCEPDEETLEYYFKIINEKKYSNKDCLKYLNENLVKKKIRVGNHKIIRKTLKEIFQEFFNEIIHDDVLEYYFNILNEKRLNVKDIKKWIKINKESIDKYIKSKKKEYIEKKNIKQLLVKNNDYNVKLQLNNYFNNYHSFDEFKNYFKDKKIAIIGPSPSVKDKEDGDFIEENFDIIVRINKQWKHSKDLDKYIGKRTDILFNCLNSSGDCGGEIDFEYLKNNKVKYIVSTIKYDFNNKNNNDFQFKNLELFNYYYYFHSKNKNRIKFIPINNDIYDKYSKMCDTRLNSGLMAIFYILEFEIKELYIKGFSFFTDGYLLDYRNRIDNIIVKDMNQMKKQLYNFMFVKNKNHDVEKQFQIFKKIYLKNTNKIKLDDKLKYLISLNSLNDCLKI